MMRLSGVLFFPVTPFAPHGEGVAVDVLAEHIAAGVARGPGGVFAACGTGEFPALSADEHATVVRTAVQTVAGRVPVLAGVGGPLGAAMQQAGRVSAAGANGVLLLPPYLTAGPDLAGYVRAVAEAAGIPVIVYQRGAVVLDPATAVRLARIPGVVGLKDGLGDIDRMQRIVLAVRREIGEEFTFFNGLPTAELTMPAYRGIGVRLYSSAVFAFAPEIAVAFNRALDCDRPLAARLIEEFYAPLVELRSEVPGYAVSLVKAAVRLRGLAVGPVRPPLVEPTAAHLDRLAGIIDAGLAVLAAEPK